MKKFIRCDVYFERENDGEMINIVQNIIYYLQVIG